MGRRCVTNHYSWSGIYHITLKVESSLRQPLGTVVGNIQAEDNSADAPRVALTAVGRMVEQELTHSITAHYPMIEVQEHVVMPDHLHAILLVHHEIVNKNGQETHLGQVIAGFKKGCNRRYWEITEQRSQRGKPAGAIPSPDSTPTTAPLSNAAVSLDEAGLLPAVFPQGYKVPSSGTTDRTPLFAPGYVDVMPIQERQLEQQRQYIRNNPRSRLLRSTHREWLFPRRGGISTALTPSALKGFLLREQALQENDTQIWDLLRQRLLINGAYIDGDSYGNRELLTKHLLPVVCHRKDLRLFTQQKQACLAAAAEGVVLVSARIARGEQAIIDEAINLNYPVILIADNGFPAIYHPSEQRIALCAEGRVLIVTPWHFHYRSTNESISVTECKTMNCVAQALCRHKDDWWK